MLHSPSTGVHKRVGWLELFYELIFVAAFIQLGNGLSQHVSLAGVAGFVGVFVPLWVAWTGFTFYVNRYTIDDFMHRTLVFVQMFGVGGMAISAPAVLAGDTAAFGLASGLTQMCVALMYFRAHRQVPEARAYSAYWGAAFAIAGGVWLLSAAFAPATAHALWGLATLGLLSCPMSARSRALAERFPIDFHHLSERYGLLTLIMLGESFVKLLSALTAEQSGLSVYLEGSVGLLLTCGVWWVYFDDVAGARLRQGPATWLVWLYGHIPLQLSITALGVAVKKALDFTWDAPAPAAYRWLLAGTLALIYFSVAVIDSVTERHRAELSDRTRVNARAASGVLLLALAPAGAAMSGGMFLALMVAINVAQVAFDMLMAPLEEGDEGEHGSRSTAELARSRLSGAPAPLPARPTVSGAALRKGTPSELRADLYVYFMQGSWWRLLAVFSVLFLVLNVFFAALYVLETGSVANSDGSFADAFFFSVQTMSTIGYGALAPAGSYGNAIVTLEAAAGLVVVAVATGLVFAKISRPRAGVLFSKCLVVTRMHGMPTLVLRVGNTRGNEIADATLDVFALMDEISPEGHHLRRLHDLPLVRRRSPMFSLTWTVMHVIDEHSPLRDVDWSGPDARLYSIVATLVGHDTVYAQTVYKRHVYAQADVRPGERFTDILSELPDGRLMVDYTGFHHTRPDTDG